MMFWIWIWITTKQAASFVYHTHAAVAIIDFIEHHLNSQVPLNERVSANYITTVTTTTIMITTTII